MDNYCTYNRRIFLLYKVHIMSEKPNSNRRVDRVVRVDVNDYSGTLLERWKTSVSNKGLGKKIIINLKELFGITNKDLQDEENREILEEIELQKKA